MGRRRTQHVADVKRQLEARLRDGQYLPGERFLSNRAVARRFEISYQTADLLIRELVGEGALVRRPASGTYLPGQAARRSGVLLVFHPRAKHKSSFGAHLLDRLIAALNRDRIAWRMSWVSPASSSRPHLAGRYAIIWDQPDAVTAAIERGQPALLLNDRPPAGLGAALIDSVSVDDFSGGAHAAQFLTRRTPQSGKMAVLSGPRGDRRSATRVAGFVSVAPATIVPSDSWFYEGALRVADRALSAGRDGIFCCNDRLAQAVLRRAADRGLARPSVVGFDDAPVARWLNLTTMAIPWDELVAAAVGVIKRRQIHPASAAIAQLVSTRIVLRN